jgi:hypothetical protein
MICKLTKISRPDTEGGLRTNEVNGMCMEQPKTGQPFRMTSEPLTEGADIRFIETTRVTDCKVDANNPNIHSFRTQTGSVYQFELLVD